MSVVILMYSYIFLLFQFLQITNIEETTELRELFLQGDAKLAQFVRECGFLKPVHKVTITDIPNIVEAVCTEFLITKTYAEILQFKEGLSVLGVSGLIEKYPRELQNIFVHNPKTLTPQDLSEIFKPSFSPRGSNAREKEELIILNWTDYLYEAEGTCILMCTYMYKLFNHTLL